MFIKFGGSIVNLSEIKLIQKVEDLENKEQPFVITLNYSQNDYVLERYQDKAYREIIFNNILNLLDVKSVHDLPKNVIAIKTKKKCKK